MMISTIFEERFHIETKNCSIGVECSPPLNSNTQDLQHTTSRELFCKSWMMKLSRLEEFISEFKNQWMVLRSCTTSS